MSPKLGAWIEGTARAPKGIKPVALAESAVRLSNSGGGMNWRRMMDANRRALETELDGRGAFELGGVPDDTPAARGESRRVFTQPGEGDLAGLGASRFVRLLA